MLRIIRVSIRYTWKNEIFSTLNGKYEFLRLPYGLKIEDVIREHIGKICYVYIDDIIVFTRYLPVTVNPLLVDLLDSLKSM